jgi:hypothetical protein
MTLGAFLLSVTLFVVWWVLGYSIVVALRSRRRTLQNMLLAPVVGLACTVVTVFLLNRAGLPVATFGPWLGATMAGTAWVIWWRARPLVAIRQYAWFAGVLVAAFVLNGWPMFLFGFDWVSYANDDMADYALMAQRYLHSAFFAQPDVDTLVTGRDYSAYYWLLTGPGMWRSGVDLTLAWAASVTGLSPAELFMPVIVAFQACLVSGLGALVARARVHRVPALVSCALLSCSALSTLGVMYQLGPQTGGLALLCGSSALLLRKFEARTPRRVLGEAVLLTLTVSALLLMYPELTPFLLIAAVLFALVLLRERQMHPRSILPTLGIAVASVMVILNVQVGYAAVFLLNQVGAGVVDHFGSCSDSRALGVSCPSVATIDSLFPYFLLPSGLANLWGFQVIAGLSGEPWLSFSIALGAALLLGSVTLGVVLLLRMEPTAPLLLAMFGLAVQLFSKGADFGLFKIAMYAQPFLFATITVGWLILVRQPLARFLPLVMLGVVGLIAQFNYVNRSGPAATGGFVFVPDASSLRVLSTFKDLVRDAPGGVVVVDDFNVSLAKFQALFTRGLETNFSNYYLLKNILVSPSGKRISNPFTAEAAASLQGPVLDRLVKASFNLLDPDDPDAINPFELNTIGQPSPESFQCTTLISMTDQLSMYNRRHADVNAPFVATPCDEVRNHLVLVESSRGLRYTIGDPLNTAVYGLEADPLFPGRTFAGVGRYLLFQEVQATQNARLVVALTNTVGGTPDRRVPPIAAVGTERQGLGAIGRGSARLFSKPVVPQRILGRDFVMLDMGVDASPQPQSARTGLMAWYGTNVVDDRRRLVGYLRDVSLVSESEYQGRTVPSQITTLPTDLTNPDLEYSGIYEDGWLSDQAFVSLKQPEDDGTLSVRGLIPQIGDSTFTTALHTLVDGQEVDRRTLIPGEFELHLAMPGPAGVRHVELEFSATQFLPGRDGRPAAAFLRELAIRPGDTSSAAATVTDVLATDSRMRLGLGWYGVEQADGTVFRWASNDAELLHLPPDGQVLVLDIERGPGVTTAPMNLQVLDEAGALVQEASVDGRVSIRIQLGTAASRGSVIRLHVQGGGAKVPDDPRALNFRVFRIAVDPPG